MDLYWKLVCRVKDNVLYLRDRLFTNELAIVPDSKHLAPQFAEKTWIPC